MGANTLDTYMPWNLHEPRPGVFDFTDNLNLAEYLQLADELGLHVILRPGPYICAEWELGGLPAWLLRDENMEFRKNYKPYQDYVERFLRKTYEIAMPFMKTSSGGPIIAVQIENEYAAYTSDDSHLVWMKDVIEDCGVKEKLFTSDSNELVCDGGIPGVFKTANFDFIDIQVNGRTKNVFDLLAECQPNSPSFVTEFWTGWFDHYESDHATRNQTTTNLQQILEYNDASSFNMYMFFGGTNFGFMNGANYDNQKFGGKPGYEWDVTSYDYDAPLSESGDMRNKFYEARDVISKSTGNDLPDISGLKNISTVVYEDVECDGVAGLFGKMLDNLEEMRIEKPVAMELLDYDSIEGGDFVGQMYGYTFYGCKTIFNVGNITGFQEDLRDRAQFFKSTDGIVQSIGVYDINDHLKEEYDSTVINTVAEDELIILTENAGRVNYNTPVMNTRVFLNRQCF